MKNLFIVVLMTVTYHSGFAKILDKSSSHFDVSVSGIGGVSNVSFEKQSVAQFYDPGVNEKGDWKFLSAPSFTGKATFTYYFGEKCRYGFGTGYSFQMLNNTMEIQNFQIDYREFDIKGNVFRQSVVSQKISEKLNTQIQTIPLYVTGRFDFSSKLELSLQAGILLPISADVKYNTDATFEMDAYYKFTGTGSTTVWDNGIYRGDEWVLSKQYYKNYNPNDYGKIDDSLRIRGYSVNWDFPPNSKSGTAHLKPKNIGFYMHPEFGLKVTEKLMVQLGLYASFQSYQFETPTTYKIIDIDGNYTTPLLLVKNLDVLNYGASLGIKYSF